jgi:hypothetical protein
MSATLLAHRRRALKPGRMSLTSLDRPHCRHEPGRPYAGPRTIARAGHVPLAPRTSHRSIRSPQAPAHPLRPVPTGQLREASTSFTLSPPASSLTQQARAQRQCADSLTALPAKVGPGERRDPAHERHGRPHSPIWSSEIRVPCPPGPGMSRYQNSGSQSAAGARGPRRGGREGAPPGCSAAWTATATSCAVSASTRMSRRRQGRDRCHRARSPRGTVEETVLARLVDTHSQRLLRRSPGGARPVRSSAE